MNFNPMDIPENEELFEIDLEGTTTKKNYKGKFKTLCTPNMRQRAQADILEKQLNQDLTSLEPSIQIYHQAVAQLSVRLLDAPKWWVQSGNGQNLSDLNVILEILNKCLDAEAKWRKNVWGDETEELGKVDTEYKKTVEDKDDDSEKEK